MKTIPKSESRSIEQANLTRRPRRLRRSEAIRSLVRETVVHPEDLIYPLFVVPDSRPRVEIRSMMEAAGLEDVVFSDGPPYWCAVGRRAR